MTHDEALDVLTAWIVAGRRANPTSLQRREAAEAHLSRCPDCWDELSATHQLIVGSPPEAGERMRALFGCATIEEQLYLLVGLTPSTIEKQHPHLAQHLAWCHSCGDQLVDLREMERFAGEPRNIAVPTIVPQHLGAFVERLVVTVRAGVARFSQLPGHLLSTPVLVPAGAWRADPNADPRLSPGERVTLDLGRSGLKTDVTVEAQKSGRLRLSLSLSGEGRVAVDVSLREVRESNEPLIKEESPLRDRSFVVDGLSPGRYVLEIHDATSDERLRIRLDVDAGGG